MKTKYTILLFVLLSFTVGQLNAQCTGGRYTSAIFSADNVTSNITYGSNLTYTGSSQTLQIDVYQPTGDTASLRPLIILAHGGSFIGGSKTGTDVVPLCHDFAKMGYVTASMDYRLGMTGLPFPGPDSVGATESVIRGVHDGKAAVRFFRKSAAQGNPYKVDTNNIYFAGVSAGAFIALHMAYLDQMSEYPSWVDSSHFGLTGGLEGTSGNQGYSSEINAIVNICGALGDTAWIHPGDEPVCSFHGTNDQTVPFGTATIYLLGTYPIMKVHGSSSITARVNEMGIENCFDIYVGQDHVPEVSNAQFYDTTKVIMRNFLAHYVCGNPLACNYTPVGLENISGNIEEVAIYPNPARNQFEIRNPKSEIRKIELYDIFGQLVLSQQPKANGQQQTCNVSSLPPGIYLVKIVSANRISCARLVKE
jgi:para-nitrobenzyl esterase